MREVRREEAQVTPDDEPDDPMFVHPGTGERLPTHTCAQCGVERPQHLAWHAYLKPLIHGRARPLDPSETIKPPIVDYVCPPCWPEYQLRNVL